MGQSALVAVIGKARRKVCLHHVSFMESVQIRLVLRLSRNNIKSKMMDCSVICGSA